MHTARTCVERQQHRRVPGAAVAELEDAELRCFFNELDHNRDGVIEAAEFLPILREMGLPTDSTYLRDLAGQYNSELPTSQLSVSYPSFKEYMLRQHNKLHKAFRCFAGDGDGVITAATLLQGLHSIGLPAQVHDAKRMIELLDSTADNCVTYQEFCRFACLLPAAQVNNDNVAFCWVDSADFTNGVAFRLAMTPPKQTYQRLVCGGLAGAISRSMVAPLERLRTIMMASHLTMGQSVAAMWADGGWNGLFKGNMATVVKVLPASAMQFAVYDSVKETLRAVFPREGGGFGSAERLFAGCVAGVASSVITYPLETIRTLMSMPQGMQGSFLTVTKAALQQRGLAGLYRGYSSAIINEMLGTGLGFLAYETGQQMWTRTHGTKPGAKEKGLIGALSAMLVMTATMPFELIMRRMQVSSTSMGSTFRYRGTLHAMRHILATEGFGAFYRGSLFTYSKVVPSIGAMYLFYELLYRAMAIGGLRSYDQDHQLLQKRRQECEARQDKTAIASKPLRLV